MSTYMITYFLSDTCGCGCESHEEHHDHHEHDHSSEDKIISKIKSLGAWAHFMPEAYLVKCDATAQEILVEIKDVANSGDILFVTKVNSDSTACQNQAVIDWIE